MNQLAIFVMEVSQKRLSQGGAIAMLVIGILCIILAIACGFLYIHRKKKKEWEKQQNFKIVQSRYKIYEFWGEYAYIFVIFACLLAALVLIPVSIGALV
ncbi:hypothetical protein [Mesoplasma seiffertii]|uniref:hypothetical protein n=1 Tax=Mesoplasma seiffertii TaxID=28224 RepID=UPI00047E5184|nr:hypothetical protein [Mesoplasma seiffertii]